MTSSAGAKRDDLAAQLGADRAAGAGDEHPLAGEVAGDGGEVGVDLVAAEEVGLGEWTDVADLDSTALPSSASGGSTITFRSAFDGPARRALERDALRRWERR